MTDQVRFRAPVRTVLIEEGYDPMHYCTPPAVAAEEIAAHALARRLELGRRRGFGSVKVTVRVGGSEWQTSIFPSKEHGWFLPIKKPIRQAEGIGQGDEIEVELALH